MGGMLYLMWCGLKWLIFGSVIKDLNKVKEDKASLDRARRHGRSTPKDIDGGIIYPEDISTKPVRFIDHKRK